MGAVMDWLDRLLEAEEKEGQCSTCQYGALSDRMKPCSPCYRANSPKNSNPVAFKFWKQRHEEGKYAE